MYRRAAGAVKRRAIGSHGCAASSWADEECRTTSSSPGRASKRSSSRVRANSSCASTRAASASSRSSCRATNVSDAVSTQAIAPTLAGASSLPLQRGTVGDEEQSMVRRLTIGAAIVAATMFGLPASARAADPSPCALMNTRAGVPPYFFQLVWYTGQFTYDPYGVASAAPGGGFDGAAREALGEQFAMRWFSDANHGLAVGLAPGALDADAARAAIVAELNERFTPEQAAFVAGRFAVVPMPYGEAALKETAAQVQARVTAAGIPQGKVMVNFAGCRFSDAWRVEVEMFTPITEEEVQRVTETVAEFGDLVRLNPIPMTMMPIGGAVPWIPITAPPAPPDPPDTLATPVVNAGPYVSVPATRRCVRGPAVRVRARPGKSVRSLVVSSRGRRQTVSGKRMTTTGVKVALKARRTTVAVTVRLQDGTTATRSYTYTRCR